MARDLTVILKDEPGQLARLGQATGEVGANIQGLAAFTGEGNGIIHLLFDDGDCARARAAIESAGLGVADDREVLVVDVRNQPGTLGEMTRCLAEANVNVELAYTIFGGVRIVIATDDIENARAALGE
jgi:hypothetical protein